MIQRLPFQDPPTAGDVGRLETFLRQSLDAIRYRPTGQIAMLNLACGRADETGALAGALAPAGIAFYLGMDLRATAIEEADRRWKLEDGQLEFRCGDASSVQKMKELPAFDFIFIRHQNYWHHPMVWDRLLGNALGALAPDGILVCTSYFDREHELLKASLKTRGAVLLCDARNPESRPLHDAPGKSVDRRLAIFSKPSAAANLLLPPAFSGIKSEP